MIRFSTRLCLLLAIVLAVQLGVVPRLHSSSGARRILRAIEQGTDIVYFCDSTNRWTSKTDKDVRSIGDMTASYFPETHLGQADRNGFHAGVYEKIVQLMVDRNELPKALVVPVNLRSFCPDWMPKDHFSELEDEIRYADRKWLLGARAFERMFPGVQANERNEVSQPVFCGSRQVGVVDDFLSERHNLTLAEKTRRKFILNYLYPLRPDHQHLQSMASLARIAERHGSKVVFYITPIDVDAGLEFLGPMFQQQVESNIQVIRDRLTPVASKVIDLSFALPSEVFTYEYYPDEHLDQEGRAFVASALKHLIDDVGAAASDDAVPNMSRFAYDPSQPSRIARLRTDKHR